MLADRIVHAIWGQFRKPRGPLGRLIGRRMATGNIHSARWTVSLLDLRPSDHVLEIGFGPGVSTRLAAEQAVSGRVVGVDHSATMVQAARRRNADLVRAGRMVLEQGDVAALPYPDDAFDKVFAIHCIYFWNDPVQGLRESRRVLRPGGTIAVTYQPRDKWAARLRRESDQKRLYVAAELVPFFETAGFRDILVETYPRSPESAAECILATK